MQWSDRVMPIGMEPIAGDIETFHCGRCCACRAHVDFETGIDRPRIDAKQGSTRSVVDKLERPPPKVGIAFSRNILGASPVGDGLAPCSVSLYQG
jgi:hypothetical protein